MTDFKLLLLHNNTWNHLTECKQISTVSSKNIMYKMCLQIIFNTYICIEDLALNNLQGLICHKIHPTQLSTLADGISMGSSLGPCFSNY